ncbi:MAG: hypothetical protein H6817_06260 [Phycisphaerales bacterium]|nr:hypothetical protein [Phycisphaerales bacterium]
MSKWWKLSGALLIAAPFLLAGCNGAAPTGTGDLDTLSEDSNNNGFLDVTPPDGVEFLEVNNVNIRLRNTVSIDDLGPLAAQYGIDPSLLNLVEIVADIGIDLDYGAGISDTLSESEPIAPFDKAFEIACPDGMNVQVNVVANIPFVGEQDVTNFIVDLLEGAEYQCGQTIEVNVVLDDNGNPDVDVSVN